MIYCSFEGQNCNLAAMCFRDLIQCSTLIRKSTAAPLVHWHVLLKQGFFGQFSKPIRALSKLTVKNLKDLI